MICDYLRVTGAHDTVLDYPDLFSVTLRDDKVQEFDTRWDEVLLSMSKIPSDDVLESLYKLKIRDSDQLKTVLELYEMESHQKISMPNYQKLKTMVKRIINQKLPLRNCDARNEKIETGAVVTSRRGLSGIERGKGICYQWKAKGQCSKGDQCSFQHESDDHAPKPTPKAAPPTEPSMTRGRTASRKRSVGGRSQTGRILRQQCRYYLKGTCTRSPCEYWHPPIKLNRDAKQGRSVCSRTTTLKNNQEKAEKELPKRKKRRQGCCSYFENCTSIGLCLARLSAIRTSERREVSGKPGAECFGINSKATSIRENKGPSLEKIQVKIPQQRSPYAMKFEDRSQEETERQERCARGKAWNLARNIYKLKGKDKPTFYSPADKLIKLAASTIKPEEREFVVDSGASMHMVSKRDLNSAELETMRISRSPTTEVQTREEVTVYVKELDLFVTVMLLEETFAVLSLGKLCEDHGYTYHWTSGQKATSHQKATTHQLQCRELRTIRCPWSVDEILSSSTSSSEDTVISKENPKTERE